MKKVENENMAIQPQKQEVHQDFGGYNLDQLKYQKALLLLKKEYAKEKFLKDFNELKSRMPGGENAKHTTVFNSGLLGKVAKSLSYMDYVVLGLSLFTTGRKVLSLFRRSKR